MRLELDQIRGVFAIMPTPALENAPDWRARETVDLAEAERATNALIAEGVGAIMTTGTFGEAATLTWEEHQAFVDVVVQTARKRVPVIVGPTTLNTRDTIERGTAFREIGASGFMLGRPMWVKCDDRTILSFYSDVATALPEMGIIVYDNPAAFKGKLSSDVYQELSKIDQVIAAKYTLLGGAYLHDVAAVGDRMVLMPIDGDWWYAWKWQPENAVACWSAAASCGPAPVIALQEALSRADGSVAEQITKEMRKATETLFPDGDFETFAMYNIGLDKAWIDTAGFIHAGPPRPPYHQVPETYLEGAREAGRRWGQLHKKYQRPASELGHIE